MNIKEAIQNWLGITALKRQIEDQAESIRMLEHRASKLALGMHSLRDEILAAQRVIIDLPAANNHNTTIIVASELQGGRVYCMTADFATIEQLTDFLDKNVRGWRRTSSGHRNGPNHHFDHPHDLGYRL